MTATSENDFNEIWTLADLDDAILRLEDEEGGWGIGRRLDDPECELFYDIVNPDIVRVVWPAGVLPGKSHYARLSLALPNERERVRIDWDRGGRGGVWEVFKLVS